MRRYVLSVLCLLAATGCAHDPYRYGGPDPYDGYGYGYGGADYAGAAMDDLDVLDPWLANTREGGIIVERALGDDGWEVGAVRALNIRFRRFADADRDQRLTDREIRRALTHCAGHDWGW